MANALIAFEGDSRTVDNKLWAGRVVDYCSRQYGITFNYLNNAVNGSAISTLAARAAALDAQIIADVANILVVWAGVGSSSLESGAAIHTELAAYCGARQTAGWYVVVCTDVDAQHECKIAGGWPAKYLDYNTLIRANYTTYADKLVDLGAVPQLQDASNTFWFPDLLHLSNEGYYAVQTEVLSVLAGGIPAHISLMTRLEAMGLITDTTTFSIGA